MSLSEAEVQFLGSNRSAGMVTVSPAGVAKVARVGVAVVDGALWSSGTQDRVRTKRLRRDPRCTLYVPGGDYAWLGIEASVTILDGPDAPVQNLRLMRVMQGKPSGPVSWFGGDLTEEQFLGAMVDEQRLIYQFEVLRTYGIH